MNIKELLKTRLCEEMNFRGDGYLIMEQVIDEVFDTLKDGNVPKANAQPQLSDVRELVEMVEAIPCICEECYTSRKLTQPDCPKCNYIDMDVVNKVKAHF